jgi:hypothetical protein
VNKKPELKKKADKSLCAVRLEMVGRAHARSIQAHGKAVVALAAALMNDENKNAIMREIKEQAEQILTFVGSA